MGRGGWRGAAFRLAGRRALGLDALYVSRHSGPWNWKNGDLVPLPCYREAAGHQLSFDGSGAERFVKGGMAVDDGVEADDLDGAHDGVGGCGQA